MKSYEVRDIDGEVFISAETISYVAAMHCISPKEQAERDAAELNSDPELPPDYDGYHAVPFNA